MDFDKAYVISLEESVSRRNQFFRYCQKAGLNVDWIKAVNGRKLTRDELLESGRVAPQVESVQSGTLGTMLSHIAVWDKLLESGKDIALVFEDDTVIPKKFLKNLAKVDLSAYADWDMLWLGWNKLNCTSEDGKIGVPVHDGYGNTGQFGYVIHRRGVEKLKAILLPYVGTPHDIVMRNNFDKFNAVFLMKPIVSVHRFRFPSIRKDINNNKHEKNLTLKEKIVRWIRK